MAVDFSELPCIVWVNIMKYLSLNDRYHLSITCQYLYSNFNHPSLWSHAFISMVGGYTNFYSCSTFMSDKCMKLIQTFGHLFKNVHLKIQGHFGQMDSESKQLLQGIAENCRLQILTLEVGLMISSFHLQGNTPGSEDLAAILKLVEKAYMLKELNVTSWPMYPSLLSDPKYNLFQILRKNERIKNLEALSLFWMKDCDWSERHPILPSTKFTEIVVCGFKNLKRLSLRSPMLSEQLFLELMTPERTKLELLQIFVTYSAHNPQYQMPEISGDLWKELTTFHPDVKVECTIMSRINESELGILLRPEVPLRSLKILRHAKCDAELLSSITDKFHRTMQSFVCLCDSSGVDQQLVVMATECRGLTELVFYGDIKVTTIMALAELRSRFWSKFVILEKNIKTDMGESDDEEEDCVIKKDNFGSYQLTSLHRFHAEDNEREVKIETLKKWVSDIIGFTWTPHIATDN